jgi:glycosyltransferase involved in cell wall biosynthesis
MPDKRLVILDPSYATRTGHNHAANTLLLEAAGRLGIEACLFANAALPPEGAAVPAFRPSAYGFFPASDVDALRIAHLTAHAFIEDLSRVVQPALAAGDVLLLHTPNSPLLHGLADWLHALPQPLSCEAAIGLILPPDFRQPDARLEAFNRHHYALAFELLARLPMRLRYYAETRPMEELFVALGARPMERNRLPLWAEMGTAVSKSRSGGEGMVFFVPGEVRAEKGHAFLINALVAIAQANPDVLHGVRFRFTAAAMPQEVAAFLANFPALFDLVPDKEISNQRYWELMREADFIVCTYDPRDYNRRSSSIFFEAMAAGIPAMVSAGTSMAVDLESDAAGAGVCVEYGNVESLARATLQAKKEFGQLRAHAQSAAAGYQKSLSASAFLGWLLRAA